LDDFSITIKPKQKVGIVGLSGAGKTTFVNLLLRFFDVQQGQILLNNINIRELTQESLRSQISHISQDTSLFHATIAQNIAYGSAAASLANIKEAARLAYADEFIDTLPQGYESVVGERGIKLSGGQRQRIAIARALLANRPLFLLDEATSALDSDSEAKIQKGLAVLMENKTVIAIAHRLSTISHMDRIVYLENGKILEDGTHHELLARKGKYALLWNMQAGGFLPTTITNN
jgi:ATP-binding cassette subfamily B protein